MTFSSIPASEQNPDSTLSGGEALLQFNCFTKNILEKELNLAAVTQIFLPSAHHYMLIGAGLNVKAADLIPIPGAAQTNLTLVFQRWFDANRDVNWDALIKLCDDFQDQLGKAKSNLLAYLGKNFNI